MLTLRQSYYTGRGAFWGTVLGGALILSMAATSDAEVVPANNGDPMVRVAYVIPSDRTPQANGVEQIRAVLMMTHDFYGEQMARWGYGYRTFRYETEADGVTPKIHVVLTSMASNVMRVGLWDSCRSAAYAAGVTSIFSDNEMWLVFPETHKQLEDGTIIGGACWGGGAALVETGALGSDYGFAIVGTDALPIFGMQMCQDDRYYDGMIIPEIGPLPLQYSVTWAWFLGDTLSSVCSSYTGGVAHEMGHGFGLAHDWRYDDNFAGNLMFNGLRGYRGWRFPADYSSDFVRLNYPSALFLSVNPFFCIFKGGLPTPFDRSDTTLPTLTIHTSGDVTPVDGLVRVSFSTTDDVGLAAARLRMPWDTIDEMPLSGTSVTATFATPYYADPWFEAGEDTRYLLTVYDTSGNTMTREVLVRPDTTANRAPLPKVRTTPKSEAWVGRTVYFMGSGSDDPDSYSTMQYEWDLDNDGVYEVGPSTSSSIYRKFDAPGVVIARLRVTDAEGASSESYPIALRIVDDCNGNGVADYRDALDGDCADINGDLVCDECVPPYVVGDLNCDGAVNGFDIDPFVVALVNPDNYAVLYPGCDAMLADVDGDGALNAFDIDPFVALLATQ